jgi:FMN phosphatase YigB (HAD superfamily)
MTPLCGVLFDWRGTLVTVLDSHDWARESLNLIGRAADDDAIAVLWDAIRSAAGHPDRLASPDCDTSIATHRRTYYDVFTDAGLDGELADALYTVESDPSYNEFALDVAPTIRRLAGAGITVGVISDIHFDLRPVFAAQGLDTSIDEYVLSYEHGVQKPDPAIFEIALEKLGTTPQETLMVGDRASHDGAAVALGIATLVLPPLTDIHHARLHLVEGIVAANSVGQQTGR